MHCKLTKNIDSDSFSCSPIVIFSCTDVISFARNISGEVDDAIITVFWTG